MGSNSMASSDIWKIALIFGALCSETQTQQGVILEWDPNTEPDLGNISL